MISKSRAEIVEDNFLKRIQSGDFPAPVSNITPDEAWLSREKFIDLFESQVMSRLLDIEARELRKTGESFYTIGSAGHEGNVTLGDVFRLDDMAFLHYRSGALFIQRQKQLPGSTPLYDLMLSLVASQDDPIASGRHKVFGSSKHLVPPQTSTIASHLPKAVGAALSVGWGNSELIRKVMKPGSVVFCNFGDASANHSTSLGAINHATWWSYRGVPMPLVFICEDNGIGISVPTPENWIASTFAERPGMKYLYANSLNLSESYAAVTAASHYARTFRKPVFLHLKTIRLFGHAGSDVETLYHSVAQIEQVESQDPLLHSARTIMDRRWLSAEEITILYNQLKNRIRRIGREVSPRPKLLTSTEVKASVFPNTQIRPPKPGLTSDQKNQIFGDLKLRQMEKPQHLAKLLNWALAETLAEYPETVFFGEDVGKKGGVYHVTAGLQESFGDTRVFDTLLDEQSILGTAIGMSQNGFIPVPEIQFLAYFHNAEDQLRGEAATLSFFSNQQFLNPMVIRIAGLAYQKGFGGHFHNDNSFAVLRDIPGVIIACPSNGRDAALMFKECIRQAYEFGRVCVFLEPIALYMTKDLLVEGDLGWSFEYPSAEEKISLSEFNRIGSGKDCAIVTYGNGTFLSCQAKAELEEDGVSISVFDLRWLSHIDFEGLSVSLSAFKKILIVDECRKTGSLSEQLSAEFFERLGRRHEIHRIAADDCFIPLGEGARCSLPKKEEIKGKIKDIVKKKVEPTRDPRRVKVRGE